jgi:hypothetical protein
MNKKQKIAFASGVAFVLEMALFPPVATWCEPIDHKTYQYGFFLSQVNYPECAEKLPWTWELALDRLLLQWSVAALTTTAVVLWLGRSSAE